MKEKGDDQDYLLEETVRKVNTHTTEVEKKIKEQVETAFTSYKEEVGKTVQTLKDQNNRVFEMLEEIKSTFDGK